MNFSSSNKLPAYFWVVSLITFLWYAFGVYGYLMQVFISGDQASQISETDTLFFENLPTWYVSVYAIAVFTGIIASISLLVRKRWAYMLFIISFLAVGIQQFYILTEINPRDILLSLSAVVIAAFLVWFSKRAITKGWLT